MAEKEYISRAAAVELLRDTVAEGYPTPFHLGLYAAAKAIEALPAADVRPVVRGRWIEDWETGCSECSACHDTFLWEDYKGVAEWNFCPNCGADMKEES